MTTLPATVPATVVSPALYFNAETNGIGDPNPYYENGKYSVIYLKNEGRHPFWSTQTNDAVSWTSPVSILPVGSTSSADSWIGSGSVIANPNSGYDLFYTGHNPQANPVETVLLAKSATLNGPWTKATTFRLAGSPSYNAIDFRDPFVFWNSEANAYWMVLTSRQSGKAVIALYASSDLINWTAQPPLYTESSPLNLEVPDLFKQCGHWNLIYSDQRSEYRQVRLLTATGSTGPYTRGSYDALDGKAFYAGKTAGTDSNRLLFGWIANKQGLSDAGAFEWGGDLITHAVHCRSDGELAVQLPDTIANQFTNQPKTLSRSDLAVGGGATATLTHIDITVAPGDAFGFTFRNRNTGSTSQLQVDTTTGVAAFLLNGAVGNAPTVNIPLALDGHYSLDLLTDPNLGLGVAYINNFRALSFRFYGLKDTDVSVYGRGTPSALTGSVRGRP